MEVCGRGEGHPSQDSKVRRTDLLRNSHLPIHFLGHPVLLTQILCMYPPSPFLLPTLPLPPPLESTQSLPLRPLCPLVFVLRHDSFSVLETNSVMVLPSRGTGLVFETTSEECLNRRRTRPDTDFRVRNIHQKLPTDDKVGNRHPGTLHTFVGLGD